MSPEDVRDEAQREIAVMGYSDAGRHDLHGAYADAGTTWWLESLHDRGLRTTSCWRESPPVPRATRRQASARRRALPSGSHADFRGQPAAGGQRSSGGDEAVGLRERPPAGRELPPPLSRLPPFVVAERRRP